MRDRRDRDHREAALLERVGADVIQTDHQELLLSWLAGDARARSTTR